MNIVFLDVDGVLNYLGFNYHHKVGVIDNNKVKILSRIVKENNAKIVLSSSWRILDIPEDKGVYSYYQVLINALAEYQIEVMDKTPVINMDRPLEIKTWLEEHSELGPFCWVSLDDDFWEEDYEEYGVGGHLIQTMYFTTDDNEGGLQGDHIQIAKEMFEKQAATLREEH